MKILLTGASGYLGGLIAECLMTTGHELCCVIHHPSRLGKLYQLGMTTESICADERMEEQIQRFAPDCVIHTAGVYARESSDLDILNGNLVFPFRVLQCTRSTGLKRWINIDTALPNTLNSYSLSKANFAQWGLFYSKKAFLFINLSVEQFYGPGQPDNYFLAWVIRKLKKNETILLTEGTQKRDIIHVEDVIRAIMAALTWEREPGFVEIPVCSGTAPSVREVVEYLREHIGSNSELRFGAVPMREGEPDSQCDTSGMRTLGIKETVFWKDGLKQLI